MMGYDDSMYLVHGKMMHDLRILNESKSVKLKLTYCFIPSLSAINYCDLIVNAHEKKR